MTETNADAPPLAPPASGETIRFEIQLRERTVVQDMNLELMLENLSVHRRGERVNWTLGIVRMILSRDATRDLIAKSIHMLEDEDKWAIAEAIAGDLERLQNFRGDRRRR